MIKNLKKAFTIIELVIVIAVIAILAAVMIPTYSSLVDKANVSADQQAVKQMNTQLAIIEVDDKPETIADAVKALDKVDINLDDYSPLAKNTQFYWIKSINRVIYVDLSENKVIYPENYAKYLNVEGDKYSLNGDIEFIDYSIKSNNTVSISEGGQLAKFIDDVNNNKSDATGVTKITLSDDIDLEGATCKFISKNIDDGFSKTIEIDGNGNTIYGFRDDTQTLFGSGDYANKGYGYGLFGNIAASGTVTIKNVKFSGMNVYDTKNSDTGTAGLIAGYIYGKLIMNNVEFKDCSVTANQKVGGVAGRLEGTLDMTEVKFENTNVNGKIEAAKIVGYVNGGNLSVDNTSNFDGIKVNALGNSFGFSDFKVASEKAIDFKGSNDNTFIYLVVSSEDRVYNATTTDWAWYLITKEDAKCDAIYRKNSVIYDGKTCFLNGSCCSASTNFEDGKPVR